MINRISLYKKGSLAVPFHPECDASVEDEDAVYVLIYENEGSTPTSLGDFGPTESTVAVCQFDSRSCTFIRECRAIG